MAARHDLTRDEAEAAMFEILTGAASTPQIAAFLVALRMKGEVPGEVLGFALAMRHKATRLEVDADSSPLVDTCGTGGGDGPPTFNISTVAAFVVAAAGARVAKHGNRSISSQCGSAEVLEALGVRISVDPLLSARAIREIGIGFLYAPLLHPAMKFAQPARLELKMRTVFNLLGPLTNPARANAQLIGAPSLAAAELLANAAAGLGLKRAFVVHGSDGLDEVTITGPTSVFEVQGTQVTRLVWTPRDFGLEPCAADELRGGGPEMNCGIARRVLTGSQGPQRDIVLANAAAALVAAGVSGSLLDGVDRAARAIDSGGAWEKVEALAEFTSLHSFT